MQSRLIKRTFLHVKNHAKYAVCRFVMTDRNARKHMILLWYLKRFQCIFIQMHYQPDDFPQLAAVLQRRRPVDIKPEACCFHKGG
jgi:hypothetical protein